MVVPSTVTVPLSLVTTVVPLKVIVVVVLSESALLDSVVASEEVSEAESEELFVRTEAASEAVASVELVLVPLLSSVVVVAVSEVSLVVVAAVSEELASEVEDVLD